MMRLARFGIDLSTQRSCSLGTNAGANSQVESGSSDVERRRQATWESLERISTRAHSHRRPIDAGNEEDLKHRLTDFLTRRYLDDGEGLAIFLHAEIDRFHCDFAGKEPRPCGRFPITGVMEYRKVTKA